MNSRAKGCRGELGVAEYLRNLGHFARRGQQRAGGQDSPDVVHDIPGIHFEVKRTERGLKSLYDWFDQARRDAGDRVPVVIPWRNATRLRGRYDGPLAVLALDELVKLCDQANAAREDF